MVLLVISTTLALVLYNLCHKLAVTIQYQEAEATYLVLIAMVLDDLSHRHGGNRALMFLDKESWS